MGEIGTWKGGDRGGAPEDENGGDLRSEKGGRKWGELNRVCVLLYSGWMD